MREYTIVRDSREKRPLLFPDHLVVTGVGGGLETIHLLESIERLDPDHPEVEAADYYLKGYPSAVIVERKHNIDELATNVLNPSRRARFIRELDYLQSRCRYPILLCEGGSRSLLIPDRPDCPAISALDGLLDLLLDRGISLWVEKADSPTGRRSLGELVARTLIRGAHRYGKG